MKNNFDLKGYMKENKTGAYQQLNEMWYSDMQAIGQPMGMRHTAINEEEAVEEQDMEMEEAKNKMELAFVIPVEENKAMNEDDAEYVQNLLDYAGVKAKVKAVPVWEELEVYTDDEKTARKVIERDGKYKPDNSLEEKGEVKSIGDAGKMAHANTRTNLARHRSSDMLDKMSKKDHKTNTVVGAKAAAYKAPHMKEEEIADDIFAGSDTADWNGKAERMDWEKDLVGKEVGNWKSDIEQQAGSISWTSEKYPNAIIYATPGWEGVDGIAVEVHESEEGFMDEPKLQKVVAAGTDAWKTKEGYLALMAKIFTTLEKMLTPAEMTEDDGTGRQINHDFNDDISKDPSEFEDTISEGMQDWNHTFEEDIMDLLDDGISKPEILTHFTDILKIARPRMEESIEEDEDPFGSIKGGIDKITQGDDDMDMSDDDRFDQLGGDKIKAGIEGLMGDGFDYREILQFVKDTIASKRNY